MEQNNQIYWKEQIGGSSLIDDQTMVMEVTRLKQLPETWGVWGIETHSGEKHLLAKDFKTEAEAKIKAEQLYAKFSGN